MKAPPEIIQLAWVVPNLEAAARHWYATAGIGPFLVNRDIQLEKSRHRGRGHAVRFSTAIAQFGAMQIELVEQLEEGPSAFRDTVAAGSTAFHHVAFVAEDFDEAVTRYADQGFAIAADGHFGAMRFAYIDAVAALGHMVEIVEDVPACRAFFAAIRKAAERWDGDPSGLLRELN